jgi:two-component system, response regulator RegA
MNVLLVDDDATYRERLARALRDRGMTVTTAATREEAREAAAASTFARAVVDLRLGETNGLAVVADLLGSDTELDVIVLTGFGSIATAIEAMKLGVLHYMTKPVDADELLAAFERPPTDLPDEHDLPPVPSLARVEWEHIHRVLTSCDGNISAAARLLGLHRRSLQRKLAKYPVRR